MEKVKKLSEVRAEELKRMKKRLAELEELRYGKVDYDNYDRDKDFRALPKIAQQSIKNEMRELDLKIKMMQASQESIHKDLRDAINNVLTYYGVDDKKHEIEENFNRYNDTNRLEDTLDQLSRSISKVVDWESKKDRYY